MLLSDKYKCLTLYSALPISKEALELGIRCPLLCIFHGPALISLHEIFPWTIGASSDAIYIIINI
jgi:hypothetical protein